MPPVEQSRTEVTEQKAVVVGHSNSAHLSNKFTHTSDITCKKSSSLSLQVIIAFFFIFQFVMLFFTILLRTFFGLRMFSVCVCYHVLTLGRSKESLKSPTLEFPQHFLDPDPRQQAQNIVGPAVS